VREEAAQEFNETVDVLDAQCFPHSYYRLGFDRETFEDTT